LEAKIESYDQQVRGHRQELEALTGRLEQLTQREAALRRQARTEAEQLAQLTTRLEDEKNGTVDLLRRTAQLHNEISTHGLRRDNLHTQRQRLAGRAEEITRSLEDLFARRAAVRGKLEDIQAVLDDSQSRLAAAHDQDQQLEAEEGRLEAQISHARQEHSALQSRQAVLEEMQQRHEGLTEGVRRVLAAAADGELEFVRGVLGDFLSTDLAHAEVIEAALGGAEQRLVADRQADVLAAAPRLRELLAGGGGVEVICLDRGAPAELEAEPAPAGAVARAAEWVRADPSVAGVVEALLGRTLVVESLSRARHIARRTGRRWRFVTLVGEVLESDGRVRIGTGAAPAGIISRRSELAELAGRLADSRSAIDALAARRGDVRTRRAHLAEVTKALRTAVYEANTARVENESLLERLAEQIVELEAEAPLVAEEVRQLAEEIDAAVRAEREAKGKAEQLERLQRQRESEIARLTEMIASTSRRRETLASEGTEAQVQLAEARQKRDGLSATVAHVAATAEAAREELTALGVQIEQARRRRAEAEQGAAEARRSQQDLSQRKAAMLAEGEELAESRRSLAGRLDEVRKELSEQRREHDEISSAAGEQRVQLGEAEVRIETLIGRTSEELGMDLPALYGDYAHDDQRDWDAVKSEIAELRGRVERLGNVNLDAIAEQDELQQRNEFLTGQIEDVRSSQRQLAELIRKINAESRRRFETSFEAVRGHFNELFRKLFGGGKADIVLTDPDDVLESGIEIVARPPGKELRSLTLLSGGEKTMTALSLMFSFFKARPSPFCLLDEVDAARDETNTQRFVKLVREFLETSQFVIISHAKRTIAMADQIYGVTMQVPGVSNRIAARFEDAAEMAEQPAQTVGA
jgi:chromosome segregation protein